MVLLVFVTSQAYPIPSFKRCNLCPYFMITKGVDFGHVASATSLQSLTQVDFSFLSFSFATLELLLSTHGFLRPGDLWDQVPFPIPNAEQADIGI